MKRIFFIIIVGCISFSVNAQFSKAKLQASGLTCSMCSKAVKVALEKVSFVNEVKVDIKNQEYSIDFKEGMAVSFDELKNAVDDAGFSVASLKVTGDFSSVNIQKNKHVSIGGLNFMFLNGDSQVLNGEKTLTIVDKNFVADKEFKKYSSLTKMECVKSGKAAACCLSDGIGADSRIYHVII